MWRRTGLVMVVGAGLTIQALAGCASGLRVGSFLERQADLRQYSTYDWGPETALSTGDPRLDNNPFFDRRVRMRVEEELERRGFEKAAGSPPDLLVHYHANVSQKIAVTGLDRDYTLRRDDEPRATVYDAGTLFVDLVDPRRKTLVWRGWAEGSLEGAIDDQDWMEERIDQAVAAVMARLPRELAGAGAREH